MRKALDYLTQLELNNERGWYHAHKKEKAEADAEFSELVQELIFRCSEEDPDLFLRRPAELIYRIPRDVRMWPNLPPYNPSYRASISGKGKCSIPVGCYICIQPGGRSFLAGGLHTASFRDAILMVREYIYYHQDEWERILSAPGFAANFELEGEKLKNVPRDYPRDTACGEYLKHKSWYVTYPLSDEEVCADDLGERAAALFGLMRPFNSFLNEALRDFRFPEWD